MKIKVKIHSVVDMITNSSSTVYIYQDGCVNYVKELLKEILSMVNPDLEFDRVFKVGINNDRLQERISELFAEKLQDGCEDFEEDLNFQIKNGDVNEIYKLIQSCLRDSIECEISDDYIKFISLTSIQKSFEDLEKNSYNNFYSCFSDNFMTEFENDSSNGNTDYDIYEVLLIDIDDYECRRSDTFVTIDVNENYPEYKKISDLIKSTLSAVEAEEYND